MEAEWVLLISLWLGRGWLLHHLLLLLLHLDVVKHVGVEIVEGRLHEVLLLLLLEELLLHGLHHHRLLVSLILLRKLLLLGLHSW